MIWKLNKEMLASEIKKSGAHEASILIFQNKIEIIPLQFENVRTPAANILKQELLACGGDAVTPLSTITGQTEYVNIITLATRRQYDILCQKLAVMPFFNLDKWKIEIEKILSEQFPKTVLPNGKIINYYKTLVMGIINLTPDSFFAGSRMNEKDVLNVAEKMLADGADILDIGGESTRPDANKVNAVIEMERILPVLKSLREKFSKAIISVDTYHAETAEKVLSLGADIINDGSGQGDLNLIKKVQEYNAVLVLTHNGSGTVQQIVKNLQEKTFELGLAKEKIIWDPGIGFGKSHEENLEIIRDSNVLTNYGYPVLLGTSRKSVIGKVLNVLPNERLAGTLATSVKSVLNGINILRVHDVKENVQAIKMAEALK